MPAMNALRLRAFAPTIVALLLATACGGSDNPSPVGAQRTWR